MHDEDYEDEDYDIRESIDDYEFWEQVLRRAIVRQGPDYSIYRDYMWE